MHICIDGRFLTQPMTGVQRYGHELLRCLDDHPEYWPDMDIDLLIPPRGVRFDLQLRNVRVRRVGRLCGHAWEQIELPFHCRGAVLFCPGNLAPVASLVGGQNVVTTVHDLSWLYFPAAYRIAFRAVYAAVTPLVMHLSQQVITVSESERTAISSEYPRIAASLVAIQNGGLTEALRSAAQSEAPTIRRRRYILYVGSLSRRKNVPNLLRAAIEIVQATDIDVVFIGSASRGMRVEEMGVPKDLEDRIVFMGQLNDALELIRWYKGALFLAFPSLYEASPLPPVEAMACGTPVLASDIPSLRERCQGAALYCDPGNVDDIINKAMLLISDRSLRSGLAALGAARAEAYTWEACTKETIAVLRRSGSGRRESGIHD